MVDSEVLFFLSEMFVEKNMKQEMMRKAWEWGKLFCFRLKQSLWVLTVWEEFISISKWHRISLWRAPISNSNLRYNSRLTDRHMLSRFIGQDHQRGTLSMSQGVIDVQYKYCRCTVHSQTSGGKLVLINSTTVQFTLFYSSKNNNKTEKQPQSLQLHTTRS